MTPAGILETLAILFVGLAVGTAFGYCLRPEKPVERKGSK